MASSIVKKHHDYRTSRNIFHKYIYIIAFDRYHQRFDHSWINHTIDNKTAIIMPEIAINYRHYFEIIVYLRLLRRAKIYDL